MKNFKLPIIIVGMILLFMSCETDLDQASELDAITLKASEGDGCETGFAICDKNISTCFIGDGFNRWGWTIGPVAAGNHVFGIFAGAAKCDIETGEFAGTVKLKYDGATAIVEFVANGGYDFKETHLYIGNGPYPMQKKGKIEVPTVAPGQYPYKHDNLEGVKTDSYTVDGLSGDIYIIAHAVVCKEAI